MKNMKKFLALALALVMILAMATTASAAGTDSITVSKAVAAGTHTSPVTTEVTLMIKSKSGTIAFDGLQLSMKANGSSALTGVALNENQGFDIKDLIITLPEGITFTDTDNE